MSQSIQKSSPIYWRAIISLFSGSLVAFGAEYCLQPIIPVLAAEFSLSPASASLAMSCGTGGMAIAMLILAGVASRLERKTIMSLSLILASALTIAIALCSSFELILLLRFLQGLLLAAFPALAVAYINEEFDKSIVGLVVGIYISGNSLGGLSGRVIISTLTDFFGWRLGVGSIGFLYLLIGVGFWLALPKSTKKVQPHAALHIKSDFKRLLSDKKLLGIDFIAFTLMGAFVCIYNYISYILLAPPYQLSQTLVGFIFMMFFVGTISSTVMGSLSDRHGSGRILCVSCLIMFAGLLMTLGFSLALKIIGLGVFTFGFFGAHSTACGWTGKIAKGDKAQASSMYMLFYYIGASTLGTVGGYFLVDFGWVGVVGFTGVLIAAAILTAALLAASQKKAAETQA